MKYIISYIDGHDMRFKTFETDAKDRHEALSNLWKSYPNGDFDHRCITVRCLITWKIFDTGRNGKSVVRCLIDAYSFDEAIAKARSIYGERICGAQPMANGEKVQVEEME